VTSSPGVVQPIRRSVRHAAFEGPLSAALIDNPESHLEGSTHIETQGWSAYISSLDAFRKDLKQIHLLEEELSRVKRDREILVTRLIKTTKKRPTKSDLSAIASTYRSEASMQSSRASLTSLGSNTSSASKEGKRAGKLADAQAELLGCEEHLRSLEIRIEQERNTVMLRGLEDRFNAMEAVGRMWVAQSQRGLQDLEKMGGEFGGRTRRSRPDLPADAYELDSNPSLAPSQSASQIAYEDSPRRAHGVPFPRGHGHPLNGPGSITGSILEEDEGSSDDGNQGKLVVHENRPQSRASGLRSTHSNNTQPGAGVMGVPSVNSRARPLSTTFGRTANGNDSDSDAPNYRSGGRRAASDVGAMGYRPPTGRTPLRRTFSDERGRPGSDRSSIRSTGSRKKKKGFFASLSRMFKGTKRQDRSGSPPYGSSSSKSWQTRTDTNIKRSSSMFGSGRRGGDDSSSDEETGGNFVAVSNQGQGHWSVDNVGRPASRVGLNKRNSTNGPVASGLIPQKPVRAKMNRGDSQSTITGRATPRPGAATPTQATQKAVANAGVVGAGSNATVSRSNTMKSSASAASVKSGTTAKSSGTVKKKTRPNGSISRSTSSPSTQNAEGRTIMSLVDMKTPPPIEIPKAPKSQVNPQMELPKAPGSSLVPPAPVSGLQMNAAKSPPAGGLTRSKSTNSVPAKKAPKEHDSPPPRATTPLPPSRLLSPPLKSALRPSSPNPASKQSEQAPPPPQPMFAISAPGPVNLPEEAPKPISIPAAAAKSPSAKPVKPEVTKRNSYHSMTSDAASIYESAQEDGAAAGADDESSGSESDEQGYQVVDNERVKKLGINIGPPHIERVPSGDHYDDDGASESSADTATYAPPSGSPPTLAPAVMAPGPNTPSEATSVSRRKSVRMAVPDSPGPNSPTTQTGLRSGQSAPSSRIETDGHTQPGQDRVGSPEPAFEREQWSTRIGRMRDDTSSESDHDDEYLKARKGLSRNSGKWELDGAGEKKKGKKLSKAGSTAGSVKSKSSVKRA